MTSVLLWSANHVGISNLERRIHAEMYNCMGDWKWRFLNKWIIHMLIAHDAVRTNDEWCTKLLMNDCIVFDWEFIELESCLVGPIRYQE